MTPALFTQADGLLLARVRAGEPGAEAAAMARWEGYVDWFVRRAQAGDLSLDRDDLSQAARLGLLAAIRTWRPDGEAGFVSYAFRCITNMVTRERRRQWNRGAFGLAPRGVFVEVLSLEAHGCGPNGEEVSGTLGDILPAPDTLGHEVGRLTLYDWVCQVLADHPRQLQVIVRRFGLDGSDPVTNGDLARELGFTKQCVSQQEKKALRILRAAWRAT